MAEMTYQDARFIWQGTFEERFLPKEAGFRWSPDDRVWWTSFVVTAARLAKYAKGEAADLIAQHHASLESSRAVDADIEIPSPAGLSYLPFQKAGIAYILNKLDEAYAR